MCLRGNKANWGKDEGTGVYVRQIEVLILKGFVQRALKNCFFSSFSLSCVFSVEPSVGPSRAALIFHSSHWGGKSCAVHQGPTMLDGLLKWAALKALSLANQNSSLPSHATTVAWAGIPDDGLSRPTRTPYGLLWSLNGAMDTHINEFTPVSTTATAPVKNWVFCWQGATVSASVTGGHGWSQSLTNPGYYRAFVQPAAVTYQASGRGWGWQKGIHDLSLYLQKRIEAFRDKNIWVKIRAHKEGNRKKSVRRYFSMKMGKMKLEREINAGKGQYASNAFVWLQESWQMGRYMLILSEGCKNVLSLSLSPSKNDQR